MALLDKGINIGNNPAAAISGGLESQLPNMSAARKVGTDVISILDSAKSLKDFLLPKKKKEDAYKNITANTLDNNIVSAFELDKDNLVNFHNKFGADTVFVTENKSYTIRTQNYFTVSFKFLPPNTNVEKLFSSSLLETNVNSLKYFIQEVDLPNMRAMVKESEVGTGFINGSIPGHIIIPSTRQFSISFLNTEFSLHEHCFYYWMKETISNTWVYDEYPFTKADIIITFTSMKDNSPLHSIILTDCFPFEIISPIVNQNMDDKTLTRKINFNFNNIYVSSVFTGANWESTIKTESLPYIPPTLIDTQVERIPEKVKSQNKIFDSPISKAVVSSVKQVIPINLGQGR